MENRLASAAAVFITALSLGSCDSSEQSPDIEKLRASELHIRGQNCRGSFFAIRGDDFVYSAGDRAPEIIDEDVTLADRGSHEIEIIYGKGEQKLLTDLVFDTASNSARFTSRRIDPPPTADQLQRGETAGKPMPDPKAMENAITALGPLDLCPIIFDR
jgi:hypothetical protein